jgi:uncharacterized protein (TIGR01370 family)
MLVALWSVAACAAPNIALYYGANPPWDELRAFDVVVVEPDHGFDPKRFATPTTELFAYVSLGEVQPSRAYAKDIPPGWLPATNSAFGSRVVDQAQPLWREFFLERVVAPLWERGYRGFFLDTLDAYHLIAKTDAARASQEAGMIALVRELRRRFPGAKLIFNRGFEILPETHGEAFAVAAESLFRRYDHGAKAYGEVPAADRAWLLAQLKRVTDVYHLPVLAIDYVAPENRELARATARDIAALGFVPWVSVADLDALGLGAIEVMPRKVLMLYDGAEQADLTFASVLKFATLPLNYLGYVGEYRDVRQPLPEFPLAGRYAGIVTWFGTQTIPPAAAAWLRGQTRAGVRIAVFDDFGFALTPAIGRELGLDVKAAGAAARSVSITRRDPLIGFELEPLPDRRGFMPLAAPQGEPLLSLANERGEIMDAAALTPWGGYVLPPYSTVGLPGSSVRRWVIEPVEFLRRALALPAMPQPDVTTENGRRLMIAHIDGDGFPSHAELPGAPYAGEVLRKQVLEKYRVPHTVSVIEGEVAPNGLYPQDSPQLEKIARAIFALPHVEIASHSFSHPFRWQKLATGDVITATEYSLKIPNYTFDLKTEIDGSLAYIDTKLAPPGKRASVFLWSGDANPGADAVAMTYAAGVRNMNGGETLITRSEPTLTLVAPLGIPKGEWFQVYAPNQNENVYTNLWTGPYYGFERAIETFELTDKPRRLKPINIYYHSYSASKKASLAALDKVYHWALAQPVFNIYASEYVDKVLDFNRIVVARSAEGWLIRGGDALRELRAPVSLGVPDVAGSRAVAGYSEYNRETYIHLAGAQAMVRFAPPPQRAAYLADANGRVERATRDGTGMNFALRGHLPLAFTLGNAVGCQVSADGKPLAGAPAANGALQFKLPHNASAAIQVACRN